jgi:NADH-quinone oxidoreductase subunit N
MDWNSLLLMRYELGLLAMILLLVIFEIFSGKNQKGSLINFSIILFAIFTAVGFLPLQEGSIFGGMFRTNNMLHFFKGTLNVGVLILLLQSADWLKDKVIEQNKSSEFIVLLFSSLLGMYFMISSGDFLMFYIGLELATLPVAALVAYETMKRDSAEAGVKYILSSALASGTAIFGISLLYATTGTIYFDAFAEVISISNLSV